MSNYKIKQYIVTEPEKENFISGNPTDNKQTGVKNYVYYKKDGVSFTKNTLYELTIKNFTIKSEGGKGSEVVRPVYFTLAGNTYTDYIVKYISLGDNSAKDISFYFIPPEDGYTELQISIDHSHSVFGDIPKIVNTECEMEIVQYKNILDGSANQLYINGSPNDTFVINGSSIILDEEGYYKLHGDVVVSSLSCAMKTDSKKDYITATILN